MTTARDVRTVVSTAGLFLAVVFLCFSIITPAQAQSCPSGQVPKWIGGGSMSGNWRFEGQQFGCAGPFDSWQEAHACASGIMQSHSCGAGATYGEVFFDKGPNEKQLVGRCYVDGGTIANGGSYTATVSCVPEQQTPTCPLTTGEQIDVTSANADSVRPTSGCVMVDGAVCSVQKVSDIGLTISSGPIISHRLVYEVTGTCPSSAVLNLTQFDEGCISSNGMVICPVPNKKNCGIVNGDEVCASVTENGCGTVNGVEQCTEIKTNCGTVNGVEFCAPAATNAQCGTVNGITLCPGSQQEGCGTVNGVQMCTSQVNEGTACVTTSTGNTHCVSYVSAPNLSPPRPDTGTPGQAATPGSTLNQVGGGGATTNVTSNNSTTTNGSTFKPGTAGGTTSGGTTTGGTTGGTEQGSCGGSGQPACKVDVDGTGVPTEYTPPEQDDDATQRQNAVKNTAEAAPTEVIDSGFLDGFLPPSSGGCQTISINFFGGITRSFPPPVMCDFLSHVRDVLGWILGLLTAFVCLRDTAKSM